MIVGWIRKDDETGCGGKIAEGDEARTSHGRPYAFQGARVSCRKNCVIAEGYLLSTLTDGHLQVIHGMKTSGGCPCISTLNDIDGIDQAGSAARAGQAGAAAAAVPVPATFKPGDDGEWIPVYAPLKHEDCAFDQHVVVVDQDGTPLGDIPYTIVDARGAVIEGRTEANGTTRIVAGHAGEVLDCTIGMEGAV
jgi:uncharacterized Zn-binding protein involved in type VI secretion